MILSCWHIWIVSLANFCFSFWKMIPKAICHGLSFFPPFLSVFLSYSPISLFSQRCLFCVRYIHLFVKPRNTYRMFYQSPSLWSKVIINLKNWPFKVSCFSFLEWTEVGRMYISAAAFFLRLMFDSIRINLPFRIGGLITLFHCSIPVQGSHDNIATEKLSKA